MATDAQPSSEIVTSNALVTFADLKEAASAIAPAFKMTPDQALVLLLLGQAEGLHPMMAMRLYHIIEGKPSMRADAMQAKFQRRGGKVTWTQFDAETATASFSHPSYYPEPVTFTLTFKEAQERGLVDTWDDTTRQYKLKKNWAQHGAAMLRARVISAGVRMVDPGAIAGVYTPEEIEDMAADKARQVDATVHQDSQKPSRHARAAAAAAPAAAEPAAPAKPQAPPAHVPVVTPAKQPDAPATPATELVGKPGASAWWVTLQECGKRLAAAINDNAETGRVLTRLNERFQCGFIDKGGKQVRSMGLCPPDHCKEYCAEIEEEIRARANDRNHAGARQ